MNKMMFIFSILFSFLLITGCKQEYLPVEKPSDLFRIIAKLGKKKDREGLAHYIYNIHFIEYDKNGEISSQFDSQDKLIDGIVRPRHTFSGQFGFHPVSIKEHTLYVDNYTMVATDMILQRYLFRLEIPQQDATLNTWIKNERERVLVYTNAWAAVFFLRTDEGLKVLFSQNLDLKGNRPRHKDKNLRNEDEGPLVYPFRPADWVEPVEEPPKKKKK